MSANGCVKVTLFEMMTLLLDPHYISKQTRADEGPPGGLCDINLTLLLIIPPELRRLTLQTCGFQASRHDLIIWPCT